MPKRLPAGSNNLVACIDEEDTYPREALTGDSLSALAAFCEVRFLVRRCEGCRDLFRRGKDLPAGFYSWRSMPPNLAQARKRVEDCREALSVGIWQGLRSKDHQIFDWTLEHERAIDQITPLAAALSTFKQRAWKRLSFLQRITSAREKLEKFELVEQDLGLAYAEALGAAKLLKLKSDDRRVVISGAYACYRLQWLARGDAGDFANDAVELKRHAKTIITVSNDLNQFALAEKIDAMTKSPQEIIAFAKSALFDQLKGHLIEGTRQRLNPKDETTPQPEITTANSATPELNPKFETEAPAIQTAAPTHSADFTCVNWYGKEYRFALGVQSSAVKVLWEEWENTKLGLHQDTIREKIDAERDHFRIDKTFRRHPALGAMIIALGDGRYKLAAPSEQAAEKIARKTAGIPRKARRKPR